MLSPEIFLTKIKPLCDNFLKNPNESTLEKLDKELQELEPYYVETFQKFIIFPLLLHLDNKDLNSNHKLMLLAAIKNVLSKSRLKQMNALKTIIFANIAQIYDFENSSVKTGLSEEIKLSAVNCIEQALRSSTLDVLSSFYTKENSAIIGRIAVCCVSFMSSEKYRTLRIASITCLKSLFYVNEYADLGDIVFRKQIAEVVFVYLPKIVETLLRIATDDEIQGQTLISESISALNEILALIFQDYEMEDEQSSYTVEDFKKLVESTNFARKEKIDPNIMNNSSVPMEKRLEALEKVQLNSDWFKSTAQHLKNLLPKLQKLRSSTSVKIRFEYAKMCCNLLLKCTKNLKECSICFIESIIAMSQDEDQFVSIECENCIENMKKNEWFTSILTNNVEEIFSKHMIPLPRIIKRKLESEQISEFLFLKGFLKIVPSETIKIILCRHSNLNKLCMCLISALELDLHDNLLVEEYALRDVCKCEDEKLRWKTYKNVDNDYVVKLIEDICIQIGQSPIIDLVFDEIIEIGSKTMFATNEIIHMLCLLVAKNDDERFVTNLLNELLEDKHWYLSLQAESMSRLQRDKNKPSYWFVDRTPGLYESAIEIRCQDISLDEDDLEDANDAAISIHEAKFNVLHTAVVLNTIGEIALNLKEKFKPYIFRCLHKILQKSGSSNRIIHESGNNALNSIRIAFEYDSIANLIYSYSDYISFHINLSLKKAHHIKDSLDILSVVLQFSSENSISHLENIILTILEECSKCEQSGNVSSFLSVFHMFLVKVNEWNCHKETELKVYDEQPDLPKINFHETLLEILNKKSDNFDEMDNDEIKIKNVDESSPENQEFENNKMSNTLNKEIPTHIAIVIQILNEVLKFVPSKEQIVRVISLDCLSTGLPILAEYENELLPLVHSIWYPFVERFKDKDPIVLYRCFTLLEVLSSHAKDFLRQRTVTEVVPFLNDFLRRSAQNTLNQTVTVPTQEFKLQQKLLEQYPNLIINMEVSEKVADEIFEVILLYLNMNQPKPLQVNAVGCFTKLLAYNSGCVYAKIKLNSHCDNIKVNVNSILHLFQIK